jgi:hypothetical protein
MTTADELKGEPELKALLAMARQELSQSPLDLGKLDSILSALLKNHAGDVYALSQIGILAAVLERWKAWKYASDGLGAGGDPALGYIAYLKLVSLRPEKDSPTAQNELLGTSSKMGSIPAKILLLSKRRLRNPIVRALAAPPVFVYFCLLTGLYWVKDKNDRRLPLSLRQNIKGRP